MTNNEKVIATIHNLKAKINFAMEQAESKKPDLYIKSWVLGGLEMIEEKAKGTRNYYPYNATYKDLLKDFEDCFYCRNISEDIKDDTLFILFNDTSILELVIKLEKLINAKNKK